jgi:hypothetical protein
MSPTILTRCGISFNLVEPTPEMIEIGDIAHALANLCRFTGHTKSFYSVAEHCVRASREVPAAFALEALLHDATEAYLGDVSSPLKALLPDYQAIEHRLDAVIRQRFGLPAKMSPEVKRADLAMLATERTCLMPSTAEVWTQLQDITPAPLIDYTWTPREARQQFLSEVICHLMRSTGATERGPGVRKVAA